jgi:hypothetical protein
MTTINFIIDVSDAALKNYLSMDANDAVKVFTRGDLNWCLQTYLILKNRSNLPMKCTNSICDNSINLVHSDQLLNLEGEPSQFIVCVRADYPKRRWAHYHIVQNKRQLEAHTSFVPHWVQPGLIKRNPNRRGVKRVAYVGEPRNGNLAGSIDEWKNLLSPHGIEFATLPEGSWHDLSEIDVLIGVRSFTKRGYDTKPPTKLFSAWHANIPFVGGYDSAFMQVGVPGEDYLLAGTAQGALAAILQLRDNQTLYDSIVKRGQEKARLYDEDTIADAWLKILQGPVVERYKLWKSRSAYERQRFQVKKQIGSFEHLLKQNIKKLIR